MHSRKECKSKHKCAKCQKNYHTLLHFEEAGGRSSDKIEQKVIALTQNLSPTVLLATTLIKFCYSTNGTRFTFRAMVDQGSTATVITERAAQLLRSVRKKFQIPITTVGDITSTSSKQYINLQFGPADESSEFFDQKFFTNAHIMTKVMNKLPLKRFDKDKRWKHFKNLNLADPEYNIPANIDILLGGDVWTDIVLPGLRLSKYGSPIAQRTKLGWILNGKIKQTNYNTYCFATITESSDESIDEQLKQFWQMEKIGDDNPMSEEEQRCVKFYEKTTTRTEEGSYVVRLPFSTDFSILGKS